MSQVLGAWLREQRRARGWDIPQMARELARAAGDSRDTLPSKECLLVYIRRWERGTVGVSERYKLLYCTAFGIEPAEFDAHCQPTPPPNPVSPHPEPAPPTGDPGPAVITAHSGDPSLVAPQPRHYRDDESRRREQPAEPAEQIMIAAAEESQDFGEWADTSNIGDATLEHYAGQVRHLAREYVHAAPLAIFLDTKRLRDRVFTKLQGHQRPDQTRDLYLIAGRACGLLAWMSGDLNFYGAADTHAWTAWVCAEQADHDGARAWVRATQTKLAYWNGRFAESAQLAEDGLLYACADSGRTMLALFLARAQARLGRMPDAAASLAMAQTELERAGPDEIGGLWSVDEARYHSLAGNVQMWRQDADQVLAEAEQALALFDATDPHERNYGAEAHTWLDQAQAHLQLRDLDGADAALRPVLAMPPEKQYEPISQHLRQVERAISQPEFSGAAKARELQEEIETSCQESIVNDLRP
jgi:hypothetical protein